MFLRNLVSQAIVFFNDEIIRLFIEINLVCAFINFLVKYLRNESLLDKLLKNKIKKRGQEYDGLGRIIEVKSGGRVRYRREREGVFAGEERVWRDGKGSEPGGRVAELRVRQERTRDGWG
ncbi:MAG: hypothetical protein LBU00_08270 [Treponema sp.]|jgi:hypothetical protein|nr:hypothetical protein [Treponema sp.]